MAEFILALDQGTTSSRSIVFDGDGRVVALAQREFRQHFPRSGWVEHDAEEIWATQAATISEALERARITLGDVAAIGITNQRETTVLWDRRTGRPVAPAIVWQDRRTADVCARLKAEGLEPEVARRTGLLLDPYFSGTKLAWLLQHLPDARARAEAGELAFGTIDAWLVWKLTQGARHCTDATNASRTLLLDVATGAWDEWMLDLLRIPRELLPEVLPSSLQTHDAPVSVFGRTEVPIAGIAGDQHAALFGQACFEPGMAKNTYGTGCFLLLNTGDKPLASRNRLLTTIAWQTHAPAQAHTHAQTQAQMHAPTQVPAQAQAQAQTRSQTQGQAQGQTRSQAQAATRRYALEGAVFVGGAVVQWLRDGLGFIERSTDVEALAASVDDTGGVYLVPAFTGLGTPHWDAYARGTMVGLSRGTTRAHIARAALEAIAFQSAEVLLAMQDDAHRPLVELRVDGGATSNDLLMQFQADLLGVHVVRPHITETTALGAAYLAGLGVGFWPSPDAVARQWRVERRFEPAMSRDEAASRLGHWSRAVERSRDWHVES